MTDPGQENPPPPGEVVLGRLEPGPRDSQLGAGPAGELPPPPPAPSAGPKLPRGGLVMMRKSGGLLFSSLEVVVFRSGRVSYRRSGRGLPAVAGEGSPLADEQLAELRHLIAQADLGKIGAPAGGQPPDAFAYQVVARGGRRAQAVEVFDGSIPAGIAALIDYLRRLAPAA